MAGSANQILGHHPNVPCATHIDLVLAEQGKKKNTNLKEGLEKFLQWIVGGRVCHCPVLVHGAAVVIRLF